MNVWLIRPITYHFALYILLKELNTAEFAQYRQGSFIEENCIIEEVESVVKAKAEF